MLYNVTMSKDFNLDDFETPTKQAVIISNILSKAWSAFGQPTTVMSESGKKLMTVVIAAWEDSYPVEANTWKNQRSEELLNERTIKESIKAGGHNSAAYPCWVFQMRTAAFPQECFAKKETKNYLIKNFPVFRTSNYT